MKRFVLTVLLLGSLAGAVGADTYIYTGASGANDGASWTDALEAMPTADGWTAVSSRGDVVWFADDTHDLSPTWNGWYQMTTPDNSGSTSWTWRKATAANHGTETGWSDSMGDGQTVIKGFILVGMQDNDRADYFHIDGQVGYGDGSAEAYGFVFQPPTMLVDSVALLKARYSYRTHWTIEHCEFDAGDEGEAQVEKNKIAPLSASGSDFLIENCYMHDSAWVCLEIELSDSYLQDCYIENRRGGYTTGTTSYIHGSLMTVNPKTATANFHVRRNVWTNCNGTAYIETTNINDGPHGQVYIYNNLFIQSDLTRNFTNNMIGATSFAITENYLIAGNTFWMHASHTEDSAGIGFYGSVASDEIKNNLFLNCDMSAVAHSAGETHLYNAYWNCTNAPSGSNQQTLGSNPCTGAPSDLALDFATDNGLTLGAPYTTDYAGNTRGADSVWDRGAYEYVVIVSPPETAEYVLFWDGGIYFHE